MIEQTAMQIMYEELMCYEYTIPLELIVRCKELIEVEKEQIVNTYKHGQNNGYMYKDVGNDIIDAEQYYKETYGGKDL